jgi:hypothetical protein
MTEQTQVTNSPAAPGSGGNRMLIIGGIVALAVVAIVVVGAIYLIPKLFGADENAIASVMPPNTSILVEVNALNLANEDASRISRAFEDLLDESNVQFDADDPASMLEQLDDQLDEASGLTITDDILPWIGPNMGIGLVELDVEALNDGEVPMVIFASTIRDIDLADRFIEDLIDAIEDQSGNKVTDDEYQGMLAFEIDSDFEDERLAFGRSGETFIFASNIDALEEAVDAQQGENLGDVAEYKSTIADLPGNRALTVFISGESVEDAFKAAEDSGDLEGFDSDIITDLGLKGAGMSAMVTSEGIRVDFVSSYENLTEEQQTFRDAQTNKIVTADFLPESTYVYIVGQRLDLIWQNGVDALASSGVTEDDFNEAMDLFDDMFGFNPNDDLLPLLNSEYSFALIDSNDGLIADGLDVDLGAIIMLGSDNGEELAGIAEDFRDGLEDQDFNVDDSGNDDVTVYEAEEPGGDVVGAYGVSQNYLILATSPDNIEDLFSVDASLADSDKFKNVWDAFPRGTVPVMYMDLTGLLASLENLDPDIEDASDLNPVYAYAMGTNSNDTTSQTTMIFFIAGE